MNCIRMSSHWRALVRRGQQQGARPTTPVRADVRPRGASRSGRRSAAGVGVSPHRCAPLEGLNRSPVWHLIECSFASLSLFNNGKERTTRPPAGGREAAEQQPSGERSDFSLAAPLHSPSVSLLLLFSSAARNERRLHSISRFRMDRSGRYESSQPIQRCERITCAFLRHLPNVT